MESLASMPSLQKCLLHGLLSAVAINRKQCWQLISFPEDEEACLLEGENMRDNLQEIGRASAQGTEDLIKDTQEQSIDLLEQKVLLMRFNHAYASGIKIVVPNIQTQGSEV
ncbi:MAG: 3-methyl-2-oxobutanoate hydroxymethyltransferase [Aureobasidium pullulans]|nr:MAG: 3-methyl-2-oxobutanoate hydroxymethyltransferase [Aureobasidium pullulans]